MQIDFKALAAQLTTALFVCDEDGVVVHANAPAQELVGADSDWFEEHPAEEWLRGSDGLLFPPLGERWQRELTLNVEGLRGDGLSGEGRTRQVRATISPLPVHGAMGWLLQLDVEPRQRALEGIRAVAHVVSEQLGSHLRTIVGRSSDALMGNPEPSVAEHLRAIHAAGQQAAGLQRQVAALGGEAFTDLKPCSLGTLLLDSERSMLNLAGDVTLSLQADDEEGPVKGNPEALALMFEELAGWAADVSPPPDSLRVEVQCPSPERVRLMVTLGGLSLGGEALEQAFEPGHSARLGLALVHAVVTRHAGRVLTDHDSATLYLEFPAHAHPRDGAKQERGTETVLLVEDDPSVLGWVTEALQRLGYQVLCAENGIAASVLLRERHDQLDLLLTDAVLPGRSGPELIAEAKSLQPDLPVLLMSGFSEEFLGGQLSPELALMRKPFGPKVLGQRVRELLDGR